MPSSFLLILPVISCSSKAMEHGLYDDVLLFELLFYNVCFLNCSCLFVCALPVKLLLWPNLKYLLDEFGISFRHTASVHQTVGEGSPSESCLVKKLLMENELPLIELGALYFGS